MSLKSTPERYGNVALTLHWSSAALILLLIPMGFAMQSAPDGLRMALYRVHVVAGLLVGGLTLFRIIWWLAFDRKPHASENSQAFQRIAAKAVHGAFYIVLLLLTASGIGTLILTGLGSILASGDGAPLPANLMHVPPRLAHGVMARLLIALLVLHVLGALYHHWIKRDGLAGRMLPQPR